MKVEHVVSVLEKKYPYVEVNSILGIDSAYDQNRKVTFFSSCHVMAILYFPSLPSVGVALNKSGSGEVFSYLAFKNLETRSLFCLCKYSLCFNFVTILFFS